MANPQARFDDREWEVLRRTIGESSGPPEPAQLPGERRLLIAILLDATRTYRKYACSGTRRGRRLFGEVESWFMDRDAASAMPFIELCDFLNLDAERIRHALTSWRARNAVMVRRGTVSSIVRRPPVRRGASSPPASTVASRDVA
jgi:hypothetical protein